MPEEKAADLRRIQRIADNRCGIFGGPRRPAVYRRLQPERPTALTSCAS